MPSFVAEESLNSVRVFWLDQDKLLEAIHKIAVGIGLADENVKKIVLFGSLAEKKALPGSDVDLLIILKEDDKAFPDRIAEWSERFVVDFPVEVFPFTQKELSSPIAVEAVRKGIVLFERE